MSARTTVAMNNRRKQRRWTSFAWIAGVVAITIGLLVWEQIALLYVLATLGVTVLLIIVAFADLDTTHKVSMEQARAADDSAAIGDNLTTPAAPPATKTAANVSTRARTRNLKRR